MKVFLVDHKETDINTFLQKHDYFTVKTISSCAPSVGQYGDYPHVINTYILENMMIK